MEHFKNKKQGASGSAPSPTATDWKVSASDRRRRLGPGGLAQGVIGPVAVEPGQAPLHGLAITGKAAILDDGEVDLVHLAVAGHGIAAAKTTRNVVGLPGPEGDFVDIAVAGNDQTGVPEGLFLLLEHV